MQSKTLITCCLFSSLLMTTQPLSAQENGTIVKIDSIVGRQKANFADALRGQVAGLQVTASDGAPGAALDILIRGGGVLRGNRQPLILIDGVEIIDSQADIPNSWKSIDTGDYQAVQNLLWGIAPSEIEQVEILKESSATALYGSRGANGVIRITTRSGAPVQRQIEWSSSMTVSIPSKRLDMLSSNDYLNYRQRLSGSTPSGFDNPVDWQNEIFRTSVGHAHELSLGGTLRQTSYRIALRFNDRQGILPGTSSNDLGFRASINQQLRRNLKMGIRFGMNRSQTDMTQSSYLLGGGGMVSQLAGIPFRSSTENASSWVNDYLDRTVGWRVMSQLYVNFNILHGLNLDITGGIDYLTKERLRWMGKSIERGAIDNGRAARGGLNTTLYNADARLSYQYAFNKQSKMELFGAFSVTSENSVNSSIKGYNYTVDDLKANGIVLGSGILGKDMRPIYNKIETLNLGITVGAKFSLFNQLDLSGGVRADQLSGYDSQFRYYPYGEATWQIARAYFFAKDGVVDQLNLNTGWGRSGKNSVRSYTQADEFTLGRSLLQIPFEKQIFHIGRTNSDLQEFHVGVTTSLWKGRLTADLRYYQGEIYDSFSIYNRTSISPTSKAKLVDELYRDALRMDRQGLELSITGIPIKTDDWKWTLSGNLAHSRHKVIDAGVSSQLGSTGAAGFQGRGLGVLNSESITATAFINGQAPGVFYGYATDGIILPRHEALTPPFKGTRLKAGDIKFIDQNHDGQVDEHDKVVIGNPNPTFTFGLQSTLQWKQWSLLINLDGSYGNQILNLNQLYQNNVSQTSSNIRTDAFNKAWSADAPNNTRPAIGAKGMYEISDRVVEDGSFLRLADLAVAYSLDVRRIKWIESLDFNLRVSNLVTLTRYQGYHPEVNSFAGDWAARGIDLGAYPQATSYSIGFTAKF